MGYQLEFEERQLRAHQRIFIDRAHGTLWADQHHGEDYGIGVVNQQHTEADRPGSLPYEHQHHPVHVELSTPAISGRDAAERSLFRRHPAALNPARRRRSSDHRMIATDMRWRRGAPAPG